MTVPELLRRLLLTNLGQRFLGTAATFAFIHALNWPLGFFLGRAVGDGVFAQSARPMVKTVIFMLLPLRFPAAIIFITPAGNISKREVQKKCRRR